MNKNQLTLAMIAAQFAVSSTTLVQAQVLEEVIVTARKINENLMKVPVAVSVVNGATMDREGITNLEQISARIPTLQLGRSALASSIYIRGIGSGINLGFEQSVGMYTDGIYQVRSRQFTKSMVDLERIEVLRGPELYTDYRGHTPNVAVPASPIPEERQCRETVRSGRGSGGRSRGSVERRQVERDQRDRQSATVREDEQDARADTARQLLRAGRRQAPRGSPRLWFRPRDGLGTTSLG